MKETGVIRKKFFIAVSFFCFLFIGGSLFMSVNESKHNICIDNIDAKPNGLFYYCAEIVEGKAFWENQKAVCQNMVEQHESKLRLLIAIENNSLANLFNGLSELGMPDLDFFTQINSILIESKNKKDRINSESINGLVVARMLNQETKIGLIYFATFNASDRSKIKEKLLELIKLRQNSIAQIANKMSSSGEHSQWRILVKVVCEFFRYGFVLFLGLCFLLWIGWLYGLFSAAKNGENFS